MSEAHFSERNPSESRYIFIESNFFLQWLYANWKNLFEVREDRNEIT